MMTRDGIRRALALAVTCMALTLAWADEHECGQAVELQMVPGNVGGSTNPVDTDDWYLYVPTTNGDLTLFFISNPGDLNRFSVKLGCVDDGVTTSKSIWLVQDAQDTATIPVYHGLRYYIGVAGDLPGGPYTLGLTGPSAGGVPNAHATDDCAMAYRVHRGAVSGNGVYPQDPLWFEYTPAAAGTLTLDFVWKELPDVGDELRLAVRVGGCDGYYIAQDVLTAATIPVFAGVDYYFELTNTSTATEDLAYVLSIDGPGIIDLCPLDPFKADPGQCGCGVPDADSDGDGVLDCLDECPGFDDHVDCNGNRHPDGCDILDGVSADCDANGIPDECQPDPDGDAVPDVCDNCPAAYNPSQTDTDGDGAGNACDYELGDLNCDGMVDFDDVNPFVIALVQADDYPTSFPECTRLAGDFSGNGELDFDDIHGFVVRLTQ